MRMSPVMIDKIQQFILQNPRLVVLTGAGISTASGIPDYRDEEGAWKLPQPMTFAEFKASHSARQRYWARSALGWPRFDRAQPNEAHRALAELESLGFIDTLITQNVDRLHHLAGHNKVINLHGLLHEVLCLDCGAVIPRRQMQQALIEANPALSDITVRQAPDGDAQLKHFDFTSMAIPKCKACDGVLKPNVVFFGESVPRSRVELGHLALQRADALLVVGSSLQVFSGYRFVRNAVEQGMPVAAINLGATRADDLIQLQVKKHCGPLLKELAMTLAV
jgi:NAD-dependent SIR2 family protein deacetylase